VALTEKQLCQRRDNDTNTHAMYGPPANTIAIIRTIVIANTTGSSATIRLFLDDDGSTYDESTAMMYDVPIPANTTIQLDGFYPMNDPDGNLAYQQGTANALTVTVFGVEIT